MPSIPALPGLATHGADAPTILAGIAPAGFSDALLAFLSPESLPGISVDDAQALGWSAAPKGGRTTRAGSANALDDAVRAEPKKEEAAAVDPNAPLVALAGFPVVNPAATPVQADPKDAATRIQSALDALGSAMPRAVTLAVDEAVPQVQPVREREDWKFEMLEAHFAAAQAAAHAAAPAPVTTQPSPAIDAPLGSAGFREQTADAVRWMVREGESRAEISIRPAELGPIQVELRMVADRVEVQFVAAHPDTRDALQDQLPQLRDLLAESGIQLGQASVRDQASQDAPAFLQRDSAGPSTDSGSNALPAVTAVAPRSYGGDHLVDTFA